MEPAAFVAVNPGSGRESLHAIEQTLFVGRECAGVDERHRLLIDDQAVSRRHLEIQVDGTGGRAWVVDTSTNGTLLNGVAIEPSMPVPLRAGDQLTVGSVRLEFRLRA